MIIHMQANAALFLAASIINFVCLLLMAGVTPSAPYRSMAYVQTAAAGLQSAAGLIFALAIVEYLGGTIPGATETAWLHSLMAAALVCSALVTLARVMYEYLARRPQIDATQRVIQEIQQQVRACERK